MGICETNKKYPTIPKEDIFTTYSSPMTKNEIFSLYSYEPALCKIRYEILEKGQTLKCLGTGFFCKIEDKNIPFRKALFTNNHILDENILKINKHIEIEYCGQINKIEITKDRKVFTNEELDYTCLEILEKDNIPKFFNIDQGIFINRDSLNNKDVYMLNNFNGNLSFCNGKILKIQKNIIEHSVSTDKALSGSPLIMRYNNLIIGIHFGTKKKYMKKSEQKKDESGDNFDSNLATPFDAIIKDIIDKLSENIYYTKIIQYRKTINLIYNKKNKDVNCNRIFGSKFVENNKDKIILIINNKRYKLIEEYNLKEGRNNIQIIIVSQLTNLEYMFENAISLENIEELLYLDTEKVNNFSGIFFCCKSLSNIKSLGNWNVSNGINFSYMFYGCKSLSDIKSLQNWNVSNGKNFKCMFWDCTALSNIKPLQNWNVSKGNNFPCMFSYCTLLSNIKPLQNWNVSNGKNFSGMFGGCLSLSDIKSLQNWDVSNGNNFSDMFNSCISLSNVEPLHNWNVSKGNNFSCMFYGCKSLSDIKPLKNWNVSNGYNFKYMFRECSTLSNIKPLKTWNFSKRKKIFQEYSFNNFIS